MLILGADEVRQVLDGGEAAVLDAVRGAYVQHARGGTAVPHSVFLRFPGDDRNRIIALPAYLAGEEPVAGVKWIASFPGNIAEGGDRASAAIILNSTRTGAPEALVEGSIISARRTAASAAVAAATLAGATPDTGMTLLGCGVINFEVLRFTLAALSDVDTVTLFDLDAERARVFAARVSQRWPHLKVTVAERVEDALAAHHLVSIATTATVPHLPGEYLRPGTLVLHVSLRDLTPATVLGSVNVVDDADHVCRAATSLHLAEQEAGHRDFIAAAIGDVLCSGRRFTRAEDRLTVFSPFGLGMLDLALAGLVRREARRRGLGTELPGFLPAGARP
ncbi:2,3-diaminopropionate biosynthesis protein SbnB [Actinophytocola sp.]|uniref:2,3-diaminopropionate biosynthesis protein SbnB n=1 Tax=Actinophytocola sp. TaxID=1872138 RepID=UPI003899D2C3